MTRKILRRRATHDGVLFRYLQPTEQRVKIRSLRTVSPVHIDATEPSEKQEKISWSNTLAAKTRLGRLCLAYRRPPRSATIDKLLLEIRIRVGKLIR